MLVVVQQTQTNQFTLIKCLGFTATESDPKKIGTLFCLPRNRLTRKGKAYNFMAFFGVCSDSDGYKSSDDHLFDPLRITALKLSHFIAPSISLHLHFLIKLLRQHCDEKQQQHRVGELSTNIFRSRNVLKTHKGTSRQWQLTN